MTTTTLDPTTFEEFHSALRPKVVSYLSRFVGSSEAEDLAQDVFIKVHQGIDTFRGESKLTTWVFQIATFAALDRLKSASYRASQRLVLEFIIEDYQAQLIPAHDQQAMKDEMCKCIRGVVPEMTPEVFMIPKLTSFDSGLFSIKEMPEEERKTQAFQAATTIAMSV